MAEMDENPWSSSNNNNNNAGAAAASGNGKPGLYEKKKLSRKVSEKFGKTKVAAATGMKKVKEGVKEGASASAYWMKIKYHAIKNRKK